MILNFDFTFSICEKREEMSKSLYFGWPCKRVLIGYRIIQAVQIR